MRKDSITLPTIIAALIVWAKGCQAFVPFLPSTLPTKTLISPATFHRKLSSSTIEASKSLPKTNDCLDCNIIEAMPPMESAIRKFTMICYVASMCLTLPVALFPVWLASQMGVVSKHESEFWSLEVGELCARWLLAIMPFLEMTVISDAMSPNPQPCIWVCNHTSMLDTFILLASDLQLRGRNKRPIKTIYWKGLEKNPICNLLFHLCGFIPVDMQANGSGVPNEYDKKSFIKMLRQVKKAFEDGFDILILPEGQLNPWPEKGLLEVFPGAHKLSVISRRPIQFIALHGLEKLWHADEDIGMHVTCKDVRVRGYAHPRHYETSQEFVETFQTVVGYFGAHGMDHPRVEEWLDGAALSNQKLLETASSNTMAVPTIMDNAEKAILTALERERQRKLLLERVVTAEDEPSKHEAVPIGVHRGKSLSTKHTMVP